MKLKNSSLPDVFALVCLVVTSLWSGSLGHAATYTVCSSGCDATSFTALFSAKDLGPGDIVEARADTPGGSRTFNETLSPGRDDFGAEGNPLILRAREGDHITFDAESTRNYAFDMSQTAQDYITIRGFAFTGARVYAVRVYGINATNMIKGFTMENCSILVVSNSFVNFAHEGFVAEFCEDLRLSSNFITSVSAPMPFQTDGMYIQNCYNVMIEGNTIIMRNDDGQGHNDCIQFAATTMKDIGTHTIRNNRLVQKNSATSYTQLIYHEYALAGTLRIYNNFLIVSNATTGSFAVSVVPKNPSTMEVHIENNTLWVNGNNPGFRLDEYVRDPYVRNNIYYNKSLTHDTVALWLESVTVTPSRVRNNIWYSPSPSTQNLLRDKTAFRTWSAWQAAGYDVGGYHSSPGLKTVDGTDLTITPTSLAYNAGLTLPDFATDHYGVGRPDNGAWDIGAFEHSPQNPGLGTAGRPNAPTNLRSVP